MSTLIQPARRLLCATGCAAMLLLPGACAGGSRAEFCTTYQPVYTAAEDTPLTRDQADINNAVWQELCEAP